MRLRQVGVALVAPGVIAALWAATVFIPNVAAERDLEQRLAATEQQAVALTGRLEESKALAARVAELEEQSIRLDRAVPPTVDTIEVIRLLHTLAVSHGVAVSSVSPAGGSADSSLDGTGVSTLTMSLEGSYQGTLGFIDGLLVADRLVRIDRVDLSADAATGSLFVDLTVSTYSNERSAVAPITTSSASDFASEATLEAES